MKNSLSLRLFSGLAAFAPLVSSQSNCGDEGTVVFERVYAASGSSARNCTARIETTLSLRSSRYSDSELGLVTQSVIDESLQVNGYNASSGLINGTAGKIFTFACKNVDNYPAFFNLSISLFAANHLAMGRCLREYGATNLAQVQNNLAEELAKAMQRENQEQARTTLYIFLGLSGTALFLITCLALYLNRFKRQRSCPAAQSTSGYGTFATVELPCSQSRGDTDNAEYEIPLNAT